MAIRWMLLIAVGMLAMVAPCMAQPLVCVQEKMDVLLAKIDVASAQREGKKPPDPDASLRTLNACLQANGLPPDSLGAPNTTDLPPALMRYAKAIQASVEAHRVRPKNLSHASCKVRITQVPGGNVTSVAIDPSCSYDEAGRKSVVDAVMKAQPLPYKGYEGVFREVMQFTFIPDPEPVQGGSAPPR